MRRSAEVIILVGVLALSGCATKKYVQQRVDERGAQLDEKVGKVDQAQQGTQRQLEGDEPKISAADEKASAADSRASDAIGRADAASKKADQVKSDLRNELNSRIANLDDYKQVGEATVLFKFNSAQLTDEGREQLDQIVASQGSLKSYFVAIEGYTDKIGPTDYNLDLSRRRAQVVQSYLVAQKNVPVYRVQIIGLGKDKPVNEQKTRDDRSKNRRVEVTLFSADGARQSQAQTQSPGSSQQ